jgi:hypothetical protein
MKRNKNQGKPEPSERFAGHCTGVSTALYVSKTIVSDLTSLPQRTNNLPAQCHCGRSWQSLNFYMHFIK